MANQIPQDLLIYSEGHLPDADSEIEEKQPLTHRVQVHLGTEQPISRSRAEVAEALRCAEWPKKAKKLEEGWCIKHQMTGAEADKLRLCLGL